MAKVSFAAAQLSSASRTPSVERSESGRYAHQRDRTRSRCVAARARGIGHSDLLIELPPQLPSKGFTCLHLMSST